MLAAQTVVDAERPCFEIGEDAVDPRQDDMGGHGADDVGVVPDARGHRGLLGALGALEGPGLGLQGPALGVAAGGAPEPLRPANGKQVLGADALVAEAALKGDQGTRIVGHGEHPPRQIFMVCSYQNLLEKDIEENLEEGSILLLNLK